MDLDEQGEEEHRIQQEALGLRDPDADLSWGERIKRFFGLDTSGFRGPPGPEEQRVDWSRVIEGLIIAIFGGVVVLGTQWLSGICLA